MYIYTVDHSVSVKCDVSRNKCRFVKVKITLHKITGKWIDRLTLDNDGGLARGLSMEVTSNSSVLGCIISCASIKHKKAQFEDYQVNKPPGF